MSGIRGIFGKVGRTASEGVGLTLHLISSKCIYTRVIVWIRIDTFV